MDSGKPSSEERSRAAGLYSGNADEGCRPSKKKNASQVLAHALARVILYLAAGENSPRKDEELCDLLVDLAQIERRGR